MAEAKSQIPRIAELADQLEEDIRVRGLKPGDRYLTTADASKMLGVGGNLTNRALQLLDKRNIINRQQRRGSFIAHPSHASPGDASLRRVHLLVHQRYFKTEGTANDGVLVGMQGELPGSSVSISFLPTEGETEFVDSLVNESLNSNEKDGFVLIRASLETQRHIAASGLPAVSFGTAYPSVKNLATVNRNNTEIGAILARHLISLGHQRIVFLTRQVVMPGDYQASDAIQAEMAGAGLGLNDYLLRALPADEDAAEALSSDILSRYGTSTGFICRHSRLAIGAARAVAKHDPQADVNSKITVCDYYLKPTEKPQFTYPRPLLSPEEQGQHIGRFLALRSQGKISDTLNETIPIELEIVPNKPVAGNN